MDLGATRHPAVQVPPLDLLVLAIGGAAMLLGAVALPEAAVRRLGAESGIVATIGAAAFAVGAVACAASLIRCRRRDGAAVWLAIWGLLCVFFMGEEVAWFTRVLPVEVPQAIIDRNVQGEFTLHNLDVFEAPALLDAVGTGGFDLGVLLVPNNLFRLGFAVWFLLLPVLAHLAPAAARRVAYPRPDTRMLLVAWPLLAVAAIGVTTTAGPHKATLSEVAEAICAVAIAIYLIDVARGRSQDSPATT